MFDAIQNELQYRFGTQGALKGNIQKDETGSYSPNLLQSALGVTSEQLTNAANTGERNRFKDTTMGQQASAYNIDLGKGALNLSTVQKDLNEAKNLETISNAYLTAGGDPSKLSGLNSARASSLLRERKQENTNEAWTNNPQTKQEQDRYYDLQQDKLADRKDARDALTFSREDAQNQRMFARRESSLDRAQTQDLAILSQGHQMKLAQMNQDLAEKRMGYDRETRRMDKRDRMIAQLMAGLGSLGNAF